jgi:hypothetical protein
MIIIVAYQLARAQDLPQAGRKKGLAWSLIGGARSAPIGAGVAGDFGYDHPLWGDWGNSQNIAYGYIRPGFIFSTSGRLNSANAYVTIAPISFVTLTLGQATTLRPSVPPPVADCEKLECSGLLRSDYGALRILLATDSLFFVGEYQIKDQRPSRDGRDFYDYSEAVFGASGYDRLVSSDVRIGWRGQDESERSLAVGAFGSRSVMIHSGDGSQQLGFFASRAIGQWTTAGSLGVYKSGLVATSLTLGVVIRYSPSKGLAL